jgi:chemotaxis protein methyltransferase CheR
LDGKNAPERDGRISRYHDNLLYVTMSDGEFNRFSRLVQDLCGIKMPPVKKTMLEARLRKRMRALGLGSFKEYWKYIDSVEGKRNEIIHMIDVVTTNKTDFFREPAHLEYLYNSALPDLLKDRGDDNRSNVRVWSAGCSTGKEAYSIAMVMSEYSRNVRKLNFSILGTDISTDVLEKAAKGIYKQEKADTIPTEYRKRYLLKSKDPEKQLIRVAPEIRSLVSFGRLNFLDEDYGFKADFDIVFCRNVIIYFDRENQQRILRRICSHIVSGGYLFTGHSETLHGMELPIKPMAPSVYKKED